MVSTAPPMQCVINIWFFLCTISVEIYVCPQSNYVLCPTITNRETLLTNIFKIIRIKLFIHQTSKYDVASVHELFKPSPVCGGLFFGSHFNSCLEAKNTEDPGDHTTLQSVTAGDEEN